MTDRKDFLVDFTCQMKEELRRAPIGLFDALDGFAYTEPYRFEEELSRLEQMKTVLDKILSILYHPAIKVETESIVKRSELSGKLSHESFMETMQDPKLWKEKRGSMVPEYVHTVETIDTIDIYENRFIAMLIKELEEDIALAEDDLSPLVESIEEHFQNKSLTFGTYSIVRNLRKEENDYPDFVKDREDQSKEDLINLVRKIHRRLRNMKSTEFFKITSKRPIKGNIIPTNILIHDRLYSYCYRYYVEHYKKDEKDERKDTIYYFNYVLASLLLTLKRKGILKKEEISSLTFDEEDILSFDSITLQDSRFTFTIEEDKKNLGLHILTTLSFDEKKETSDYYLIIREKYSEKTKTSIHLLKEQMEKDNHVILIVSNNLIKDFSSTLTLNIHKEDDGLLLDLLASLRLLVKGRKDIYQTLCPVCGTNHVRFDGNRYCCQNCNSVYTMGKIDQTEVVYLESIGKE